MGERKEAQMQSSPLYTAADFFLLRAPVLPAQVFSHIASMGSDVCGNELENQHYYAVLQELAAQPEIELALAVSSFAILEGIAHIRQGEKSHRVERTYSRLFRYITRMSTRPTPFGMFAGVAVGTFADTTTTRLSTPTVQKIRSRPDMSWLLSVIKKIEQTQELVPQLSMVVNQTVYITGGRVILPFADVYGQQDQRSISLRATPVVQYVLERARQPIPFHDLHSALLERFPQASPEQAERLIMQLWENHYLTSNLRPPLTDANPACYTLEQLTPLSAAEDVSTSLSKVLQKAEEIDRVGTGGSIDLIRDLKRLQEQLVPENQLLPFQVDTSLKLDAHQLTHTVGAAAAQAGETLLRLSRLSQGLTHLHEYRAAFMERYGMEAEVPLLELLSPETGLDAPPTYAQPPRTYGIANPMRPPSTSRRDSVLSGLVAQAINDHSLEVELTESLLRQLEQWTPQAGTPPPSSLEIYLQLHADSPEALDCGEWRAVVSPNCGSPGGGRTFCRFFDLLKSEELQALQRFIRQEEALAPDVIYAELSYLPTTARAANVAIRPALRDYEIVMNTTPSVAPEKVIHLNDLVVGIHDNRFYLRSLPLGKEVVVCQSHMLNHTAAPNVCRFLLEMAQDNRPGLSPFDWGAHTSSPFLPRIVQGRVVLYPATWNVQAAMIEPTGNGSEDERWFAGLQQWRAHWRVPRYVYIVEADNRLLLDLEHPRMAAELYAELKKFEDTGSVAVQEMLPDFNHLWLRDRDNAHYIAEIVVPLIRTEETKKVQSAALTKKRTYLPRIITREERSIPPGDAWTYLKVYAASKQHDGLIAGPLREIVQKLREHGMIDRWFFIRYADPEPHLRLRFHAANTQFNEALLVTALAWGRQQVENGMVVRVCVDTYDREIERYGGPKAIDSMERVFTINSMIINNIIAAQYAGRVTIDPLAVAVFSLDRYFDAWGLSLPDRLLRLEKRIDKYQASKEFREQRKLFCELLAPWDQTHDPVVAGQREHLEAILAGQESALRPLAAQIRQIASEKELWLPEDQMLDSLAHMHINRLLGINREQESKVYAFWRHTLNSINQRPAKNKLQPLEHVQVASYVEAKKER